MSLNNITKYLIGVSVGILLFGVGYKVGLTHTGSNYAPSNAKNIDFSLFWDTWNELENKFVDKQKVDPKMMYYGAIKGMVASMGDPYTFFLTPEENKESKDDLGGKFEGIGAELGMKNNAIVIVAPIENSPAEKAGIHAGDIIYKIDGKSVEGMNLYQVVSKIRGTKGTKVKLTLVRNNKELNFEITRDQIVVSSVKLEYENNIAILRLSKFGDDTDDAWDRAINEIQTKFNNGQVKGMVLDLRGNPGGYLQSAVYIASDFLEQGKLVVRQQYSNGDKEDYKVTRQGRLLTIPITVLIDEGSASAAEIVSGALRDHKRAQLVGMKSFGKGSIQEAIDMSKGAGLHVTIAKWILPNGDWIHGIGVQPNVKVENTIKEGNTLTREDDKQLNKAIELLK